MEQQGHQEVALQFCKCRNKGSEVTVFAPSLTGQSQPHLLLCFLTLPGCPLRTPCLAIRTVQLPSGFHQFSLEPPGNQNTSVRCSIYMAPPGFLGRWLGASLLPGEMGGGLQSCFELAFLACGWQALSLHCPCKLNRRVTIGGFQT